MININEDNIEMFVEIPKGSSKKYEWKENRWILDRTLSTPMVYPEEYGSIPNTLGEDGDELDVICHVNEGTFPGCHIKIRVLGVIKMIDNGQRDDKIIAVDASIKHVQEIKDLEKNNIINKIKMFFERYKDLENKKVEIIGIYGKEEASEIIKKAYLRNEKNN